MAPRFCGNSKTLKSKFLPSRSITFEFEVLGSKTSNFVRFEHPEAICQVGWMLKASISDDPRFGVLGSQKHSNRSFNLASRGMTPGWLDAKSFDLGWYPELEVWELKNIQIKAFTVQGYGPRMLNPRIRSFAD